MKSLLRGKKRIKQGFLVLTVCILCIIISTFSFAANVITNGTFNGNLNNWTLSKAASSSSDDGILYNTDTATADGTGCMRGQTKRADGDTWAGNATQSFTVDYIDAHVVSATLNFTWRKWAVNATSQKHNIKVQLIDPGSITHYEWTDIATQAVGTGAWNAQTNIDVKSNIQAGATGSWTIKICWNLQAGAAMGSDKGQCGADFDDISLDIVYDTTPPVTTLSVNPTSPDGNNSWYITNPTVTLTRDEPGATYYQWTAHGVATPTTGFSTYSGAVQSSTEGWRDIWYYSVDNYTNQEVTKVCDFKIDTQHASSTVTAPTDGSYITSGPTYTVTGTASDPSPGSDVGGVQTSTNGGDTWNAATNTGTNFSTWEYVWTLPEDGTYTIQSKATDNAGNVETPSAGNTVTVDTTPPTVLSTDPVDGSVGVANAANIYATFSESMEPGTITTSTFTLYDDTIGSSVTGAVSYDELLKKATLNPTSDLVTDHNYTATITTGVKDLAGHNMASNYTWSFSTRPPQIPSGLVVEAQDGKNYLTWNLNPEANVFYKIYRASSEKGSYNPIHSTDVGVTTYDDVITKNKQYYWYKISAIDQGTQNESSKTSRARNEKTNMSKTISKINGGSLEAANGEISLVIPPNALSANTTVDIYDTTAPAGLTLISDYFDISLGGATLSSGATLTVRYSTSNPANLLFLAHWDDLDWSFAGGVVSELNSTISLVTTIFSGYGATWDSTPPVWPATPPPHVTLTPGDSLITVNWVAASDAESEIDGYEVYRSIDATVDRTDEAVGSTDSVTLTYQDTSVIPGEDYYYAIFARNGVGLGTFSDVAGPEAASGSEKPHGVYEDATDLCKDCHEIHRAVGSTFVFRRTTQKDTCYVCHDGTGSSTDIETKFGYRDTTCYSAHSIEPDTEPDDSTIKYCDSCHVPHYDPSSTAKLVRSSIRGTTVTGNNNTACYACHEKLSYLTGTADAWWGETIFEASKHATGAATSALGTYPDTSYARGLCLNCHDVHGSRYTDLQRDTSYLASEKNQLCYMCHDDSSVSFGSTYSYRGKTTYTASGHGVSASAYNVWPSTSDTGGGFETGGAEAKQCINCHNPHGKDRGDGTAFDYLLLRWAYGTSSDSTYSDEEYLCYGGSSSSGACHSVASSVNGIDIENQFNKGSATGFSAGTNALINTQHDISYADQHTYQSDGVKMECGDCHNAHINTTSLSSTSSVVINPDDRTQHFVTTMTVNYTTGDETKLDTPTFCNKCHDNSPPSSVTWTATKTKNIATAYTTDAHGSGSGGSRISAPYKSPMNPLPCTECHDPHGSSNIYHIKETIDGGSVSVTSARGVGAWDMCQECHTSIPHGTGGSSWPYCFDCHRHGDDF